MPWSAPKHCPHGHAPYTGPRCPTCAAAFKARADAARPTARARGYDSKWDKARAAFLAANPTCKQCGAPATVVDHVVPHKGDRHLFWSRSNWQPLCKPHHDRKTALQDGAFGRPIAADGPGGSV